MAPAAQHFVDQWALVDPFLARMPASESAGFRPGHLVREIPAGYLESLVHDQNLVIDGRLAALLDDVFLATRAPLLAPGRAAAIVRLARRRYDLPLLAFHEDPPHSAQDWPTGAVGGGEAEPPVGGGGVEAPPVGGGELGAPPVGGRGVRAPPVGGRGVEAPPVGGRGVEAPPVGGRGVEASPVGGRGVEAPPVGGRELGAPPVGGRGVEAPPVGGRGVSPELRVRSGPAPSTRSS